MAGKAVRRPAELKVLTTTSLYGSGSSQYNRLSLRNSDFPKLENDIVWQELAHTAGFGAVHLSSNTAKILRDVTESSYKARRVNNRFGEGTSPRLRQIREGLGVLGINSDDILSHATPRLLYVTVLMPEVDKQLLGLKLSKAGKASNITTITDAWHKRWLLARIRRFDVIERLAKLGPLTIRRNLLPTDESGQYELPLDPEQPVK